LRLTGTEGGVVRTRRGLYCCFCLTVLAISSVSAVELPQGFRLEPVADGLTEPSALAGTPDGRILIAERTTGHLREMSMGRLSPDPLCSVSVDATGDGGLLGVAVHPDYADNGWVYLYYTDLASGKNTVTRYTIQGKACMGAKVILADLGSGGSGLRNGGGMGFGPDGLLYVATGDMEDQANGQDGGTLQGKVLKVDDGDVVDVTLHSMGLRDPSGLTVNPAGQVYVSDAGSDVSADHDELHLAADGGNLGWADETGHGGVHDDPLGAFLPTVGIHGVTDYDGGLFPDADADGKDNDHDSYGPDGAPGVLQTDDNNSGVCIGSENNGLPCSTNLDCTPARTGESAHYCEKRDDPAEHCSGVTFGDDDCDNVGSAGIDEPDESFALDVFAAADGGIERGVLMGANDTVSNWETFFDSSAFADCPTGFTGLMTGRDGHLYALATNAGGATGGLYKIVHDSVGPREVSSESSYVPLQIDKGGLGTIEVFWEDIRDAATQVQDNGAIALLPEREYTVWRGTIGSWYSHVPVATGVAGTAVSSVLRKQTVFVPADEDLYFLVSARHDNLEGTLGMADPGERPGPAVTDLCDTIGEYRSPWNLFTCGRDFTLIDAHGEERSLHSLRGRPILLDLSAEWCPPCVTEANELQAVWLDYEDRGPVFITVLWDEEVNGQDWNGRPTPLECSLWENRPGTVNDHTFECWADPQYCTGNPCNANFVQEAWPLYNNSGSVPTNVMLDQGLRVVWVSPGWGPSSPNTIRARLNLLIGATPSCLH
jgi:hypothetical protein